MKESEKNQILKRIQHLENENHALQRLLQQFVYKMDWKYAQEQPTYAWWWWCVDEDIDGGKVVECVKVFVGDNGEFLFKCGCEVFRTALHSRRWLPAVGTNELPEEK